MRLSSGLAIVACGIAMGITVMSLWNGRASLTDDLETPPDPPRLGQPNWPEPFQPSDPSSRGLDGNLARLLQSARWTPGAAAAVEQLTREVCPNTDLTKEDPMVVKYLQGLGRCGELMPLIQRRPEIAPLLALTPEHDRVRMARLIANLDKRYYPIVEGWFKHYMSPADAAMALSALEKHQNVLLPLTDKGLLGAEKLFMFPRGGINEQNEEYDRWLAAVLSGMINNAQSPDAHRISLFSFLLTQGPDIRQRLAQSKAFRSRFRDELWPRFVKLASPNAWDRYAAVPGLWSVLEEPDGVSLVQKYMKIPFLLLKAFPDEDERKKVLQALRDDDLLMIAAMVYCRDEGRFHALLRMKITAKALRNILRDLLSDEDFQRKDESDSSEEATSKRAREAADKRQRVLKKVTEVIRTEDAIDKEYGGRIDSTREVPLIGNVLILGEKLTTGREVTWADGIAAGGDVVVIGLEFFAPGTGVGEVVAGVTKEVVNITRDVAATYAKEQFLQDLNRRSGSHQGELSRLRQLPVPAADLIRDSYVLSTVLRDRNMSNQQATKRRAVDMMPVLELLTRVSGVGKESIDRLEQCQTGFIRQQEGQLFAYLGKDKLLQLPTELRGPLAKESILGVLTQQNQASCYQRWQHNTYAWWLLRLREKTK